jgi:hypothetical protein
VILLKQGKGEKMTIGRFFPGDLQPTTTVAGCIDIYENAWPDPEKTIEMVESQVNTAGSGIFWSKATTIGFGKNQNARTNLHMGVSYFARETGSPVMEHIHNQMYVLLMASLEGYRKRYGIQEQLWHEDYNMLKYKGGTEYKAHYDGDTSTRRSVSAIIYLNKDYEGGHVEFTNFGIKIKPEPGMLLLFPSNYAYTHIAHPVVSGTKYALVTWTQDQPMQM